MKSVLGILCSIIVSISTVTALAKEKTREVTNTPVARTTFDYGTSVTYLMALQPESRVISVSGNSARAIWRGMGVSQMQLDNSPESATFQKVGENVTCERTHVKDENRHEYSCSIVIDKNGKVSPGAAG
jgi:hypothetical protein